jgi:hypothetical protein
MKKPILLGAIVSGVALAAVTFITTAAQAQTPDRTTEKGPIESVDVIPGSGGPTGHALQIVAGLPGGCAEPADAGFERYGDLIIVTVTNSVPSDPSTVCTDIYRTYDVVLDLGTDFVPGKEYIAYVNGVEVRFIAQGGIVPSDRAFVQAPLESLDIVATASLPAQYAAQIVAGLPGSCSEAAYEQVYRVGNTITIKVFNTEPVEETICMPAYRTYPVNAPLGADFNRGETDTVKVNNIETTFTAQ